MFKVLSFDDRQLTVALLCFEIINGLVWVIKRLGHPLTLLFTGRDHHIFLTLFQRFTAFIQRYLELVQVIVLGLGGLFKGYFQMDHVLVSGNAVMQRELRHVGFHFLFHLGDELILEAQCLHFLSEVFQVIPFHSSVIYG